MQHQAESSRNCAAKRNSAGTEQLCEEAAFKLEAMCADKAENIIPLQTSTPDITQEQEEEEEPFDLQPTAYADTLATSHPSSPTSLVPQVYQIPLEERCLKNTTVSMQYPPPPPPSFAEEQTSTNFSSSVATWPDPPPSLPPPLPPRGNRSANPSAAQYGNVEKYINAIGLCSSGPLIPEVPPHHEVTSGPLPLEILPPPLPPREKEATVVQQQQQQHHYPQNTFQPQPYPPPPAPPPSSQGLKQHFILSCCGVMDDRGRFQGGPAM